MSPSTDQRENRAFAAEVKFLVAPEQAGLIREWARARLIPDPNASGASRDVYQITSLYFDTKKFDVFRRTGSFGRSKYRIRRYGSGEAVFLERKLKARGLLTKRRSIIKLGDIMGLAEKTPSRGWPGYWFHRRLIARASDDSTLKLWNVATQQELLSIRRLGTTLTGLLFSPDGQMLVGASSPFSQAGGIRLYSAPGLKETR